MHIAYTITYNVHTASRVSEAQKRGGGALGVHPFLNFKGAKGLKVSIWSMKEG